MPVPFNAEATLAEFRSAVRRWQEAAVTDMAVPDANPAYAAALDAVNAARRLDQELSAGGQAPAAWMPRPVTGSRAKED
jgi:hypothetical protein